MAEKNEIGNLIDEFFELRNEKEKREGELKEVKQKLDELESKILSCMDNDQIEKAATDKGSVSLNVKIYPQITDREEFFNFVKDTGKTELITFSANQASFRSFLEEENEYPPGTEGFVKSKLNARRR